MFVVKIVVLWLAVLQITTAFDVVNPFSWKAVEDAEDLMATGTRHASAAVASLYADSVRLQQRVKEHVFAPDFPVSLPEPECSPLPLPPVQSKATGGVSPILLTLVAIPAAFLLGWVCGTRQALSRQAMQQARAADQEAAALYQTDLKASKSASMATPCCTAKTSGIASKAGAHVSAPHAIPPAETQDEAQVAAGSTADRPLKKANSGGDAESSNQASPAHQDVHGSTSSRMSVSEPDEQSSSSNGLQDQQHHQNTLAPIQLAAHDDQQGQRPSTSGAHPDSQLEQTPVSSQNSQRHLASLQENSALVSTSMPATGLRQQQGIGQTGMQHDSSRQEDGLAVVNNASYLVDVITQRLGLIPDQLSEHERLGLVTPIVQAVGVLLDNRNNQEHHRLRGVANEQGAEHNSILREGQTDTKAWRQTKEEQKQLQQFFNRLADCLMCGLILMLGGMLYWGATLGYFEGRLSECKGRRSGLLVKLWSPWQAVQSVQAVLCYATATCDLTGSVILMLLVPWFVKKHGLLANSMTQPMTGLILGLGIACGLVGQFAVGRVGGDNVAWLSAYWLWITLHVLSIWFVHALYRFLCSEATGSLSQQFMASIRMPVYYSVMGIVMPLAVAACPYWRLIVLI